MGTVYRRGRKLWIGFTGPDGRRVMRPSGYVVGQEALARKLLGEVEAALKLSPSPGVATFTVLEYATRWAAKRVEKGRHTNAKLDRVALVRHVGKARIEVHGQPLVLGKLLLDQVRLIHVRAWLEAMELKKLAPRTIVNAYSLLQRVFRDAVREELLAVSPCQLERGELPAIVDKDLNWRDTAVFSAREVEALISDERVPLDRRVTYALGCLARLREGEISAATVDAYDPTREPLGVLYVRGSYTRRNARVKSPKSKLPRQVPVHPALAALLARWLLTGWRETFGRAPTPTDLLVPNRAGRHLTDLNVVTNLALDLKTLGLRHRRFHDTGRTFVSLAREGGAVKDLLRWVSHGPSKKEMVDAYTTPAWSLLCQQVTAIRVQLRSPAPVLKLQATGTTRTPQLHSALQPPGEAMQTTETKPNLRMPRARFELARESLSGGAAGENSGGSLDRVDAEGRQETADCSASATISPTVDQVEFELARVGRELLEAGHG